MIEVNLELQSKLKLLMEQKDKITQINKRLKATRTTNYVNILDTANTS